MQFEPASDKKAAIKNEKPPAPAAVLPCHLRSYPAKLFVETTTRCNLGCIMCVKQTAGCALSEGDMTTETFAALEPAFPHLGALILNGVGEPLLNPHLETFIRQAKLLMPATGWVGFQSNGLLLTELRALSLIEAGLDRICLSLDAAAPETFQRLREGGALPDVERALAALAAAKQRCHRPDVRVGIEYVAMRSNLAELPAALHWAYEQGASFSIVTHVLPYNDRHAMEAAYNKCTAEAAALFATYHKEARRMGLDISRYFEALWKYRRSPEEQRLVAHVAAMKEEAHGRNLFLDIKKLLLTDNRRSEEVAEVFARARAVAEEWGLELLLPEIHLQVKRRCRFVEEGGAFVSWEGNVSPCYFLWHRYHCFASGWRQQVQARVFGSLVAQNILDIWNSPEYRAFREQATAYDYPDCSSCGFAPCDYIQREDFEQDCHVGQVPCGACLWCMGVFQCLQ